jgi:hypothetical protein
MEYDAYSEVRRLTVALRESERELTECRRLLAECREQLDSVRIKAAGIAPRPVRLEDGVDVVALLNEIEDGYSLNNLRDLCFRMRIDYENLSGDTIRSKARELVEHMRRHGHLRTLVQYVENDRRRAHCGL